MTRVECTRSDRAQSARARTPSGLARGATRRDISLVIDVVAADRLLMDVAVINGERLLMLLVVPYGPLNASLAMWWRLSRTA